MAKRNKQPDEKQVLKVPKDLITAVEYQRRRKVWQDIYAKARQGISYQHFLSMKEAVRTGDIATVRKIRAEIDSSRINGRSYPEPLFPDPDLEMVYGRLGIKENWEGRIEKARIEGITIQT